MPSGDEEDAPASEPTTSAQSSVTRSCRGTELYFRSNRMRTLEVGLRFLRTRWGRRSGNFCAETAQAKGGGEERQGQASR